MVQVKLVWWASHTRTLAFRACIIFERKDLIAPLAFKGSFAEEEVCMADFLLDDACACFPCALQAYGAKEYHKLGSILQRAVVVSALERWCRWCSGVKSNSSDHLAESSGNESNGSESNGKEQWQCVKWNSAVAVSQMARKHWDCHLYTTGTLDA
eukprot:1159509-Pelagomonas_calceolata.AAC.6